MKSKLLLAIASCLIFAVVGYGTPCIPTSSWNDESQPNCLSYGTYSITKWRTATIYWAVASPNSGTNPYTWYDFPGYGQYYKDTGVCQPCYALFLTPYKSDRYYQQEVTNRVATATGCSSTNSFSDYRNPVAPTCACTPQGQPNCPQGQTATWNEVTCEWSACNGGSPIIIDLDNDGYRLTNTANGVWFDLEARGYLRKWSWTAAGSDEAFLVLDRNNNGRVDDGKELFGDATYQSPVPEYNGFNALKSFDSNGDRWIDEDDPIYSQLRLWVDRNHNGISEASELRTLTQEGVEGISLNYQVSRATDQYGNRFRFRAPVKGRNLGRIAWDVFFVPAH